METLGVNAEREPGEQRENHVQPGSRAAGADGEKNRTFKQLIRGRWWEVSLMWSDKALNTNKLSEKDTSKQLLRREHGDHRQGGEVGERC